MPQAVAHILIPLLIMSFIRDFIISKKEKRVFPLHYVMIAGIAGVIPDLDIGIYWIVHFFGANFTDVHRTWAHTLFVPLIFLGIAFLTRKTEFISLRKHRLHLSMMFIMLAFGSFVHLILDATFHGVIMPFYPLSYSSWGIDLFGYLPSVLERLSAPTFDAILIIFYLVYLEWKHKISDFI